MHQHTQALVSLPLLAGCSGGQLDPPLAQVPACLPACNPHLHAHKGAQALIPRLHLQPPRTLVRRLLLPAAAALACQQAQPAGPRSSSDSACCCWPVAPAPDQAAGHAHVISQCLEQQTPVPAGAQLKAAQQQDHAAPGPLEGAPPPAATTTADTPPSPSCIRLGQLLLVCSTTQAVGNIHRQRLSRTHEWG